MTTGGIGALVVITLGGWIGLARRVVVDRPELRWEARVLAVAVVLWTLLWLAVPPTAVPIARITALHEGSTLQDIRALEAYGAHAGPGFTELWVPASAASGHPALRPLIRLDTWASGVTGMLLVTLGWRTLGPMALLLGLTAVASPTAARATLSELPVAAIGLTLALSVLPALRLDRALGTGSRVADPGHARHAAAVLVGLTLLAASLRTEMAGPGLVVLALAGARVLLGTDRLVALGDRVLARLHVLRRDPVSTGLGLVFATILLGGLLDWSWGGFPGHPHQPLPRVVSARVGRLRWAVDAVHPLDPALLSLPALLWGTLPLGLAALPTVGALAGLRHPLRTSGVALSVVLLFRAFHAASHQDMYEMVRYVCMLAVPLWALGALGWTALGRRARLGLTAACLVPPVPAVAWWCFPTDQPDGLTAGLPWTAPLDGDAQRQARDVMRATARWPDCLFVTRTAAWGSGDSRPPGEDLVFFADVESCDRTFAHRDHQEVRIGPETSLREAVARREEDPRLARLLDRWVSNRDVVQAPDAPLEYDLGCVIYYQGLDCNLVDGPDCGPDLEGLEPIARWTRPHSPHGSAFHWRVTRPELELGLYRVPLEDR